MRKVLLVLFIIAFITAVFSLCGRLRVEQSNSGIELIMDYHALNSLERDVDVELLRTLREKGLTAIAIYPDSIKDIVNRGDGRMFTGNEIERMQDVTGSIDPVLGSFPFSEDSLFIKIKDPFIIQRAEEYLPEWKESYGLEYIVEDKELILFFKDWEAKYLHISFGFDQVLIERIKSAGLKVVSRINNNPLSNQLNWALLKEGSPDYIIFAGSEITGYDQELEESELAETATIMRENGIVFGMIEPFIARQLGAASLAEELNYQVIRVHSIQQGEMDSRLPKYSLEGIVERYLLAVRERNVRLLYLKPFLEEKHDQEPVELTQAFVENLASGLRQEGFMVGKAIPFSYYSNSRIELLLIGLGIIVMGVILLEYLLGIRLTKWAILLLLSGLICELGLLYLDRVMLLRKILALGSSVIFPALAIISQVLVKKRGSWLLRFIKVSFISLLGVIFLGASLSHISFILQVDQFTGVKLSFVLPILMVTFYFLKQLYTKESRGWQEVISTILDIKIRVKHLLLLLILGIGGAVYIGRTGNFPLLPVPDIEFYFRDLLERIFYVRPRFKEFLFGHPFLVAALGLSGKIKGYLIFYLLVLLATVGQINILNTFSHAHTPLLISFLRVIHGLWLGLIIGLILLFILKLILDFWNRKRIGDHV